ncbi:hypothetical protein GDO81_010153 [Engystomops pustulosus]|uniref:EGF-like domain-containing protein n=1 Tax=Engystomops pustulosus TaxID=76066 RepID=A0AAV7BXD0_ENGPU|nr:hypothetical protein GDO81_010153 [Engystomops pustulosus]
MFIAAAVSFYLLLMLHCPAPSSATEKSPCDTCTKLVDRFHKGLEDTSKKNFGGGNTAWEEKTLSKYETRRKKYPDLRKWFCIETIEVCCPSGTYGPDCVACLGGAERPCHGNGFCSGDGTRLGDGSCRCKAEYTGPFCLECADGYFSTGRNDTHSFCSECHESCKTCNGPTNTGCKECKEGWTKGDGGCIDVDECSAETSPCKETQYCLNTEGSFSCKRCHESCAGCSGEGPDKCRDCATGYLLDEDKCTDINECDASEKVCVRNNENFVNTPGSYKCVCAEGYEDSDGQCEQKIIETEDGEVAEQNISTNAAEDPVDVHEDL